MNNNHFYKMLNDNETARQIPSSTTDHCFFIFPDTVKGSCFAKFDGRMCAMPLMKQLTRTECCCGMEPMGQRGWGSPCQGCPLEGSGRSQIE